MSRIRRLVPAVAVLAVLSGGALAQGLSLAPGSGERGPIEVLADNGIEWQQSTRRFTARGNATATRGDVSIRADELIANYRETDGGNTDISRLEAHGAVRITSPTQTATGDSAFYDLDAGQVQLTGRPAKLVTPTETLTAKDRLTYDTVRGIATAEGDATIEQGGRSLRAPVLKALLTPGPDGGTALSTVDATGGVVITTPQETAHGSQGNYDAKTGIATLTGSVRIVRGDNVLTGARAIVNMRTGISTLQAGEPGQGRARAVLNPEEERKDAPQQGGGER
ncbi:MAG: LptA/OstA family protein [Rhodospirillaceae bacterium]